MTASGNQSSESGSAIRDKAHNMAGRVVESVQDAASRMVGMGQEGNTTPGNHGDGHTASVTDKAAEQVSSRLDTGKEYVVQTITGVAQALRQTSQHLREDGAQPNLAQYADRGAEQIEHVGGYLRKRDTGQLLADAEGFARRQPMVFAGSAFALGMLAVRFLRSGSQPPTPTASGSTSPSYVAASTGTPPMPGRTGPGATPGSTSTSPRTYTGAAQDILNRAPTPQPTPPASTGANPRAGATPSVGGTSPIPSGTPSTPASGGTSSTPRPGTGSRNQP